MTLFSISKPSFVKVAAALNMALLLSAGGCYSTVTTPKPTPNSPSSPIQSSKNKQVLIQQATRIQNALASHDYASIINDIHPTKGVRFSMYAYVHLDNDKVFGRAQFAQYLRESRVRFTWGELDGIGETYVVPLPVFLDDWIEAKNFNNARITVNQFESRGNMINNVVDAYPDADVVDFYYRGSDKYDGIDWRGMRLVFEEYQGRRYLVGIVNDRWTV